MVESEMECVAPGLDTLERECVTAHSGVSDVHNIHTSLIKTETDLGSTHTGGLIKTESLDSSGLGYVTHLHPDQIKTEADDGGYLKAEHISDLQDIVCVEVKSDLMKCESSEGLVSDPMNTAMTGAGVDHKDQTEPEQCADNTDPNCKKEDIKDLPTQRGDLNLHSDINKGSNLTRIAQKSSNGCKEHVHCQTKNAIIEPKIVYSNKNSSILSFNQNKTIHENESEIHPSEKPHKCVQCEKCFYKKSDLTTHLRIHTGEKPYKCIQCEKCFCRKSDLNTHLRIHTGEKPYKCTLCGKHFSHTSGLKCHKMVHSGEKPYKCPQCEKCFSKISHLNIHQRIHTGEKPYKCTECGKCFSHRSGFSCHQMIHTGEKPYKCPQCGKCFSTISHLNIHHRIHTGEKPYKCVQCGKCFSQTSALNRHKVTHVVGNPTIALDVI